MKASDQNNAEEIFSEIFQVLYLHVYLSNILLHLPHCKVQAAVQVDVGVLRLCVFLFEQEAQPAFSLDALASVRGLLRAAVGLTTLQARAAPGRRAHAGHTVLGV